MAVWDGLDKALVGVYGEGMNNTTGIILGVVLFFAPAYLGDSILSPYLNLVGIILILVGSYRAIRKSMNKSKTRTDQPESPEL